jgi:hypothetical protein
MSTIAPMLMTRLACRARSAASPCPRSCPKSPETGNQRTTQRNQLPPNARRKAKRWAWAPTAKPCTPVRFRSALRSAARRIAVVDRPDGRWAAGRRRAPDHLPGNPFPRRAPSLWVQTPGRSDGSVDRVPMSAIDPCLLRLTRASVPRRSTATNSPRSPATPPRPGRRPVPSPPRTPPQARAASAPLARTHGVGPAERRGGGARRNTRRILSPRRAPSRDL